MPDFKRPSKTPSSERPPIWVDGRQQPRFDLRAWVKVGPEMGRRWVVPFLETASDQLSIFGAQVVEGRFAIDLSRLGRIGRYVPSRQTLGETVIVLALRMTEARLILHPVPTAPDSPVHPDVIRAERVIESGASPATILPPSTPSQNGADIEPTLSAIRAVLRGLPDVEPATPPQARAQVIDLHKKDAPQSTLGLLFARSLPQMIALSARILALPVGLTQALMFHLDGGDLADWD